MPNEPPTNGQLATTIRDCAVRLHWHHSQGHQKKALREASKLLIAVTMYEQTLCEQVGYLPIDRGE